MSGNRRIQIIYAWLSILLVNIPFLSIRIVVKLGVATGAGISLMVVKNVLFIMISARAIMSLADSTKALVAEEKPKEGQTYRVEEPED